MAHINEQLTIDYSQTIFLFLFNLIYPASRSNKYFKDEKGGSRGENDGGSP